MSKGKGWDLTSVRSLASAAEWIRNGADANLVLVVRGQRTVTRDTCDGSETVELPPDFAFAVDPRITPADARQMVEVTLPEIEHELGEQRARAKEDARLKAIREHQAAAARRVQDEREGVL